MKRKTHVLILLLMLLAIPGSTLLACGNSSGKENMEETSCSQQNNHSEKSSCCDKAEKADNDCAGACGNHSCHCTKTVNLSVFSVRSELSNVNTQLLLDNECVYSQYFPTAVYLSVWQPPKIS